MNGQEEEQQSPAGSAVGELGRTGIKNLVSTLGRKFGGKALGAILGSVIPGLGNLAGAAIGAALDMLNSLFKTPEKILGIGLGTAFGCLAALGIVVVVIIMVPIMVLLFGFGGVVPPTEADPGEPPPTLGDGTGLVADYCIRVPVKPPPYPDAATDEEKCSQKLRDLFISAGKWAKVPAGVIAGVASIEGPSMFGYTDDLIEKYSKTSGGSGIDGQSIDPANSTPNYCGAVGPMQMLIDSDPLYPPYVNTCGTADLNVWNSWKKAVNIAGVVTLANPDARNIRNAIYGGAWKIKNHSGAPKAEVDAAEFTKYDYDDDNDDWEGPPGEEGEADGSMGEVYRAAKGYLGACEHYGVAYCARVWDYYLATKDTSAAGGAPWGWPTTGMISMMPFELLDGEPHHKSDIDIAFSGGGKPVYATQDGQIFKKTEAKGCGIFVIIFGSKYTTFYCHLEKYSPCVAGLKDNDWIKAGTYLGDMGWTGWVEPKDPTGAHVHYQIRYKSGAPLPQDLEEFNSLFPTTPKKGDQVESSYTGKECLLGP